MKIKSLPTHAVVVLFFLITFQTVFAALPAALDYQGFLTNSSGTPVDGTVTIDFRLYNVELGGISLWSEPHTVTVNQGVFSIELGATVPFPLGLFEQPLWLELEVGGDGEMSPRRPITSTGFAFKADDAKTLEGVSASTLDQSAHVTDTANPHNVTPTQIGAADAGTLSSHIGNTANPHNVTAEQAGAADSTDFTTHISNSSAHHLRYTNTEAITAMGLKKDNNSLNHDRFNSSNAVAAVLAADGAGSTLDADKVDGLQSSELIDAAQDEVRTPISSLPFTISQPGSYYLTGNLDGSSGGLDIAVDDVTLDLMGFTIDGGGSIADHGIDFSGHGNVTIHNGSIKGFGYAGIYQDSSLVRYATMIDVQVLNNGSLGTASSHSGIYIRNSNSRIERCTAGNNGGYGIFVHVVSRIVNSTAYGNSGTYAIYGGGGSALSGNTAYNNTGTYSVYGTAGASLIGNTAYDNSGYGIYGSNGALLSGNTAYSNSGSYGIYAASGTSVIGNTSSSNAHGGIFGGNGSLVKDNIIYYNNSSNTAGEGGLYVYYNSHVAGNTLHDNSQNNIYVYGSDNSIENNHVTDSTNGIFFALSGNFYGNNRASGNTTNYNLNGTTQTTSTYLPNISF